MVSLGNWQQLQLGEMMFSLALWMQEINAAWPNMSRLLRSRRTMLFCWLSLFLISRQLVSALPSHSLLTMIGFGVTLRYRCFLCTTTLKCISSRFIVKILRLRSIALVLSKIISSSAVLLWCSQHPTCPCAEAELRETGQLGQAGWAESTESHSGIPGNTSVVSLKGNL